jgi:pyruvate formate lyase activating enzyme
VIPLTSFFQPKDIKHKCAICGGTKTISQSLKICSDCIRGRPEESLPYIKEAHRIVRAQIGLPPEPPSSITGVQCKLCSNSCSIGEKEHGYCGLRWNDGGLKSMTSLDQGLLYSYLDPHVTNCCGAWFCPGGTGAGYPLYANRPGPEYGYNNLSIFFYGCNFNCLFCQNASHKKLDYGAKITAKGIASKIRKDESITCICYFGGSPEPQLPFSLNAAKLAKSFSGERVLRICWEWNGCGQPNLVKEAAELALVSGGNIKFDLKCYNPNLSLALSGVDNSRAFSNFEMIARKFYHKRLESPVLTATTLLVPGYIDAQEVTHIASFIEKLDKSIPYSLLLFHPNYVMKDLPFTPLKQAQKCYKAAIEQLENVNIGNLHMLGIRNMTEFLNKL